MPSMFDVSLPYEQEGMRPKTPRDIRDKEKYNNNTSGKQMTNSKQINPKLKRGFASGNRGRSNPLEKNSFFGRMKGNWSFLIVFIIFLAVNAAAVIFFVFDVGNIRTRFIASTTGTISTTASIDAAKAQLDQDRELLNVEKNKLENEKELLKQKEAELQQREDELNRLQQELDLRWQESYVGLEDGGSQTPQPTGTSIEDIVKIYAKMDAKDAAKSLAPLALADKVKIIRSMKKDKAAEILAQMDPRQSSSIIEEMMKEN